MDTKAKTSSKAKSFCEGESTRPKPKKDQGRPLSVESAKSKGFHSRLPVRGKSGQVTPTATPTKVKQQSQKTSLEFLPEIGDEAAKLVEKLVQAEKDREAAYNNSDDESSLVDPAVVEKETFPEVQFPPSGGVFPIRPLWDQPTETQRTPEHTVPRQGTTPNLQATVALWPTSLRTSDLVQPRCSLLKFSFIDFVPAWLCSLSCVCVCSVILSLCSENLKIS